MILLVVFRFITGIITFSIVIIDFMIYSYGLIPTVMMMTPFGGLLNDDYPTA